MCVSLFVYAFYWRPLEFYVTLSSSYIATNCLITVSLFYEHTYLQLYLSICVRFLIWHVCSDSTKI